MKSGLNPTPTDTTDVIGGHWIEPEHETRLKPSEVFHGSTVYMRSGPPIQQWWEFDPIREAERAVEKRKGAWL